MKIARLLEAHNQNFSELSLKLNLGDGFLIKHNPLFRAIRTASHTLGYKYSTQMSPAYLALPLSQLDNILKNKTIPYLDNVSVLCEIEEKIKNVAVWDEVTDNLKRNQLFHESCHTLVRHFAEMTSQASLSNNEKILKILIEESFANSCELLGIADVDDSIHRLFYEINSYIFVYDLRTQLKKLIAELDYKLPLRFLVLSYLCSNFLREKISESEFNRLLKLARLDNLAPAPLKMLRSVSKIAFELNPRFRWVTTTFYLRLHGHPVSTEQLSQIDFISLLESNPVHLKLIEQTIEFLDC